MQLSFCLEMSEYLIHVDGLNMCHVSLEWHALNVKACKAFAML